MWGKYSSIRFNELVSDLIHYFDIYEIQNKTMIGGHIHYCDIYHHNNKRFIEGYQNIYKRHFIYEGLEFYNDDIFICVDKLNHNRVKYFPTLKSFLSWAEEVLNDINTVSVNIDVVITEFQSVPSLIRFVKHIKHVKGYGRMIVSTNGHVETRFIGEITHDKRSVYYKVTLNGKEYTRKIPNRLIHRQTFPFIYPMSFTIQK